MKPYPVKISPELITEVHQVLDSLEIKPIVINKVKQNYSSCTTIYKILRIKDYLNFATYST